MEISKARLRVISIIGLVGVMIGAVIFSFLHLRPQPPNIAIESITVAQLDIAEQSSVRTAFQLLYYVANPGRGYMTFGHIHLVVNYNGLPITIPTVIPTFDLKPYKTDVLNTWVVGGSIPLESQLVGPLSEDVRKGDLFLEVAVDGKFSWKLGGWPTRYFGLSAFYRLHLVGNGTKTTDIARIFDTSVVCKVHLPC